MKRIALWGVLGALTLSLAGGAAWLWSLPPATAADAFVRLGDWHPEYSGLSYDIIGSRGALMNEPVRLPAGAGGD